MRKDVERKKLNLIREVQREAKKVHILNGKKEIKIIKIDKDKLKEWGILQKNFIKGRPGSQHEKSILKSAAVYVKNA